MLRLIAVGRLRDGPEAELFARYNARLRPKFAVTEVAEAMIVLVNLAGVRLAAGRPVCFVIGGAEGLNAPVIARADYVLSLGRLTWPHFLARVMLAEQIYRARAIAAGHPYHRAGRP